VKQTTGLKADTADHHLQHSVCTPRLGVTLVPGSWAEVWRLEFLMGPLFPGCREL